MKLYKKISLDEYVLHTLDDDICSISTLEISKIFNTFGSTDVSFTVDDNKLISGHFRTVDRHIHKRIFQINLIAKSYRNRSLDIDIDKNSDDWFFFRITNRTVRFSPLFYKCDQTEGVESLILDIILPILNNK